MKIVKNDLYDYYGLSIYQDEDWFKFSLDSILLAEFVEFRGKEHAIVDMCTGNAPVPLIMSTKTDSKIYGIEVQEDIAKLSNLSVEENNLKDRITIIVDNIKNVSKYFEAESVDIVTCNPPYFKYNNSSLINEDRVKAIARHEIELELEDLMVSARYMLKNEAPFYLVHRCDRLEEIIALLSKYRFAVKKLQFIYSNSNKDAIMVLIKSIKNGKVGSLKVGKPIFINDYSSYKNIFD